MTELESYPGSTLPTVYDRVTVTRFSPEDMGYARFVTKEHFVPPVLFTGWLQPFLAFPEHVGNFNLDGIHLHCGHLGNSRNYVASIVRRDRHAKIAVEYGRRGYHTLQGYWKANGPSFRLDEVYVFELLWEREKITAWVKNDIGEWLYEAKIPKKHRIPFGAVGFRIDNYYYRGNFRVKEL